MHCAPRAIANMSVTIRKLVCDGMFISVLRQSSQSNIAGSMRSLNENHPIGLQHETRQPSGRIGASVDIDAVRPNIRFFGGCMAVDNDLAEILFVQQEVLADPKQVMLALLSQGNSWAYACVSEEEISAGE